MVLDFNKTTGEISVDESFGISDDKEPGFRLDREDWPHGGRACDHEPSGRGSSVSVPD